MFYNLHELSHTWRIIPGTDVSEITDHPFPLPWGFCLGFCGPLPRSKTGPTLSSEEKSWNPTGKLLEINHLQ